MTGTTESLTPETLKTNLLDVYNAIHRGDPGSLAEARYRLRPELGDGSFSHANAWDADRARLEAAEQLRSLLSKAFFVVEEHRHEAMLASDIRNALRDTTTLAREETGHE